MFKKVSDIKNDYYQHLSTLCLRWFVTNCLKVGNQLLFENLSWVFSLFRFKCETVFSRMHPFNNKKVVNNKPWEDYVF